MRFLIVWILVVASCLPVAASAQEVPEYVCLKTTVPPAIDGVATDPAWRPAEPIPLYDVEDLDRVRQHSRPTEVRLLWDEEHLYFLFIATDPDVWSTYENRDDQIWQEEVVEIFIDPDGDGANYAEIEVNLTNNCFASGVTTELQVFGEGYPAQVRLHSPILDLGGPKNIYAMRWGAEEPPGTRLEIRSRSGRSLDTQIAFRDKDGQEVTERRWKKLIPSFRGPIDTTLVPGGDWSPWSSSYQSSGQEFLSPSQRRYVELDVRLVAEMPQQAAALDWVSLEFADPLASGVAGEIFPTQVEPGVENEFSYYLRSTVMERGPGATRPLRPAPRCRRGCAQSEHCQGRAGGLLKQINLA